MAGIVALCMLSARQGLAQPKQTVNWISWEEALELSKVEKKKILLNVYSKECSSCRRMEQITYTHPAIVEYLNEHFYAVKFNSESKQVIRIENKSFKYTRKSGNTFHEFTAFVTNGGMSTPTSAFFSEDHDLLQPIPGYKNPTSFEIILTYYGGDHYKRTPWSMYVESYVPITKKQ